MTTVDDEFLAFGRAQAGFYAFVGGPRPVFRVGVIGLGSIAGVRGRAGVPDGPQPTAPPFHGFAGVIGESRDEPGTAGTSVNNIGVYGQTQEIGNRAPVFLAGVYGTGNTRPSSAGRIKASASRAVPATRDRRSPTCLQRAYSVRQPTNPASSAHRTHMPGFMLFPTTSASSAKPLTTHRLLAFSWAMSRSPAISR
jgi:hypothetical protein